jgi:rhomboid family GlyGly-CTERM serine protease
MNPNSQTPACLPIVGTPRRGARVGAETDASPRRPYLANRFIASLAQAIRRRPELLAFAALIAVCNVPIATGSFFHQLIFLPQAVQQGEWWRLLFHPFVHVTWYHLLLDGTAFLALYYSLIEASLFRRLLYVIGGGIGSVLVSWAAAPAVSTGGLCGLSGIAHGLMAVSALELVTREGADSAERRLGQIGFILVVGKAALEAMNGRMFFTFLHFGLMGDPVAVSHAGGIIGSLLVMWMFKPFCGRRGSADFQSAVSQTSSLRACGHTQCPQPFSAPADWKSAIRQTGSLRYDDTRPRSSPGVRSSSIDDKFRQPMLGP